MNLVDYVTVGQRNWYDHEQEEDVEDGHFWCME